MFAKLTNYVCVIDIIINPQISIYLSIHQLILWNNFTPISIRRYEAPIAPNLHIFQETAVEAFPMAIVGFAVAFSVAKVYSVKHDYTIDGNQVKFK